MITHQQSVPQEEEASLGRSLSPDPKTQVFILDSLAGYTARDAKDAESIVERVTPRLQHANCAVVLSAVKVRRRPRHCRRCSLVWGTQEA